MVDSISRCGCRSKPIRSDYTDGAIMVLFHRITELNRVILFIAFEWYVVYALYPSLLYRHKHPRPMP